MVPAAPEDAALGGGEGGGALASPRTRTQAVGPDCCRSGLLDLTQNGEEPCPASLSTGGQAGKDVMEPGWSFNEPS